MQETLTHKVFSMTLALLVLLSTFSFKMETHFCGSNIVDVAVFSNVKSCCTVALNSSSEFQFTEKSCCNNKVVSVDGLKQLKIVSFTKEILVKKVFVSPIQLSNETVRFTSSSEEYHSNYSPPDRELSFQIEHQVFLI